MQITFLFLHTLWPPIQIPGILGRHIFVGRKQNIQSNFLFRLHIVASSETQCKYFRTKCLPRHHSTFQLGLIYFPCLAFLKSFASSFQTFPCLVKISVVEKNLRAYGTFAFFKLFVFCFLFFFCLSFCLRNLLGQTNLNVSLGFASVCFFLLFLFLREIWSKLVETLQTSVSE